MNFFPRHTICRIGNLASLKAPVFFFVNDTPTPPAVTGNKKKGCTFLRKILKRSRRRFERKVAVLHAAGIKKLRIFTYRRFLLWSQ